MSVPLIQGTLRYAYKVGGTAENTPKSLGEGYAFMMSVIHRVAVCDGSDAKIIYDALQIPTVAATAASGANGYKLGGTCTTVACGGACDNLGTTCTANACTTKSACDADTGSTWSVTTFATVKKAFEDNYKCMGVTCADIGGLVDSSGDVLDGVEACFDAEAGAAASAAAAAAAAEKKLPLWAIIAIAGGGFLMMVFFGMMCAYKSSKDVTVKMYNDLKKDGARV
jgi:hypothetical protein